MDFITADNITVIPYNTADIIRSMFYEKRMLSPARLRPRGTGVKIRRDMSDSQVEVPLYTVAHVA